MRVPLPEAFLTTPLAHRGYHDLKAGRAENSLQAFAAAIAAGYGIECDIQLSADGVPMVFHDDDLDRVAAEPGPLIARSAADLGRIRLKDSSDTIPTFAAVLRLVAGRCALLVELKDQTGHMGETDARLETAVAAALELYRGPVALMCFNPHTVANLARLAPRLPRGLVTCAWRPEENPALTPATCDHLRRIPDYDRTQSSFISHEAADLSRPRVAALKRQGATVVCWTITSQQAEAEARKIAQNITFEGYPAAMIGP